MKVTVCCKLFGGVAQFYLFKINYKLNKNQARTFNQAVNSAFIKEINTDFHR